MKLDKALRLLGLATRAGKIAFGTESVIETINKKKAKLVIIANDASERTKKIIINNSNKNNIECRIYSKINDLSQIIGKENKAVIAIKDGNFSNEILKIIDGGEVIG